MDLERNNMDTTQLKRIADALEEILRLVKQDMQKYESSTTSTTTGKYEEI